MITAGNFDLQTSLTIRQTSSTLVSRRYFTCENTRRRREIRVRSRVNSRDNRIPRLRRRRPGREASSSSTKAATSTRLFPSIRAMNLLPDDAPDPSSRGLLSNSLPELLLLVVTARNVTKKSGAPMICWRGVPSRRESITTKRDPRAENTRRRARSLLCRVLFRNTHLVSFTSWTDRPPAMSSIQSANRHYVGDARHC